MGTFVSEEPTEPDYSRGCHLGGWPILEPLLCQADRDQDDILWPESNRSKSLLPLGSAGADQGISVDEGRRTFQQLQRCSQCSGILDIAMCDMDLMPIGDDRCL